MSGCREHELQCRRGKQESQFYCSFVVWSWASHPTSLILSFHVCKGESFTHEKYLTWPGRYSVASNLIHIAAYFPQTQMHHTLLPQESPCPVKADSCVCVQCLLSLGLSLPSSAQDRVRVGCGEELTFSQDSPEVEPATWHLHCFQGTQVFRLPSPRTSDADLWCWHPMQSHVVPELSGGTERKMGILQSGICVSVLAFHACRTLHSSGIQALFQD